MRVILLCELVKNRIAQRWRKKVFKKMIVFPHNDFSLVGNVHVINRNIKLGHNVSIYPDVMFFGDGLIEIGDNVDIRNGTIIYSSAQNGR